MTERLLNKSQAEAIYSAMCALNNVVCCNLYIAGKDGGIRVDEMHSGRISITTFHRIEIHDSQTKFASAYSLA